MANTQLTGPSIQQIRPAATRGLLWMGGDHIARRALDLLFTVALARLLFPRDFGLLAMAAIVTTLVRVFANVGLGSAVIQRRDVDEEYVATAFWANLAAGVVLGAITAALGKVAGTFLKEPMVGPVVLVLSIRFVISPWANVQMAILSRRMNFRAQAIVSVQAMALAGLLAVGMAYAGMGVWSLVGQTIGEYVATTILLYRVTGWVPRALFSWQKFLDAWSFGAPLL
ncbi:MAG: oligosaccharide flippase family protein, partial [bacterium]